MGFFDFFRRKKKATVVEVTKSYTDKPSEINHNTLEKSRDRVRKKVAKNNLKKVSTNKKKRATIDGHRNPSLYDDDFDDFDLATDDNDPYVKPVSNTPVEAPIINGYTPREDAIKPTPVESNTESSSYNSSSSFNSDSGSSSSDYSTSDDDF